MTTRVIKQFAAEIGRELYIGETAVKTHVTRVLGSRLFDSDKT